MIQPIDNLRLAGFSADIETCEGTYWHRPGVCIVGACSHIVLNPSGLAIAPSTWLNWHWQSPINVLLLPTTLAVRWAVTLILK
jgi:hypothetical protein